VGESDFQSFVKAYIERFKFSSITSGEFKDFFMTHFDGRTEVKDLSWTEFLTDRGLPTHPLVDRTNKLSEASLNLAKTVVTLNVEYNRSKTVDETKLTSIQVGIFILFKSILIRTVCL
jgi:aminopeptidase N